MSKGITTINLDVGYDSTVVSNINIDISPGQIVALIGPNGSGKTTVLKTITRQLNSINGKIYVNDVLEENLSANQLAKAISLVTTERISPSLMTCREVVATGRYPYTGHLGILSTRDWDIVDGALELTGGYDIAGKSFLQISDGQRQRVMIARAIAQDTDIIILDEPTSFLDIQYKLDILSMIKNIAKNENRAVILSIHELEFVPVIADYVIGICDGRVYKTGTCNQVITGANIEQIYHMKSGSGEAIVEGLFTYAKALEKGL